LNNKINNKNEFIPLGKIKPTGWLKEQLEIQAEGLTGHIEEVWEDLGPDNMWLGGDKEGWERGPYYVDGLVPLAYLLEDEILIKKAQKWINAFLDNQQEDGWIGPEKPEEERYPKRDYWPIFIVFKALTQYYEITEDPKVIEVMNNFFQYLKSALQERPLFSWAKFRWADLLISLDWLYDKTEEKWLLDLADVIEEQGYDWREHFLNFEYTEKNHEIKMETHVVNNAMGIKTPALWYKHSEKEKDFKATYKAIENLDKFHGQANGTFSGDEHLAGKNPSQGTELCAVVEYMYSLEHILSIIEDVFFADRLEKITYNALPATLAPDICSHQYDQQVNQPVCSIAERNWTNGPDANIFGLEPNFGCCTANMHQGWPKFATNLWRTKKRDTIIPIVYAPSELEYTLENGEEILIKEKTDYPFDNIIKFIVECNNDVDFSLMLRIPNWSEDPKIYLPDGEIIKPEPGEYIMIDRKWVNEDLIKLELPMPIKIERRHLGAVTISRGPLVYSLQIGEDWKRISGTPPFADWEIFPKDLWNYSLDIDLEDPGKNIKVKLGETKGNPFTIEDTPIKLELYGEIINEWHLENNWAGDIPSSPINSRGDKEKITLVPYGTTNLRITEFPYLKTE
jgi:hypothetical protein